MNPPHLYYLKEKGTTWFNPCYGINGFWKEYGDIARSLNLPPDKLWRHRALKRAKEIYATSILAKAFEQLEGGKWWMQKPINDPPDGVIGIQVEENGLRKMHVREVEVVEHFQGDIIDTIRAKLQKKQYEPRTVLVCYLSEGGEHDLKKIAERIQKEITNLPNIFLVLTGAPMSQIPIQATEEEIIRAKAKMTAVQVKPVYRVAVVDPINDCQEWRNGEGNFLINEGYGKGDIKPVTLDDPPKLF